MSDLPCPTCKSPLLPSALRCPRCGARVSPEVVAVESFRRSVLSLQHAVERLARMVSGGR
jgi:predicted amidophosphoribosyltransferase